MFEFIEEEEEAVPSERSQTVVYKEETSPRSPSKPSARLGPVLPTPS